MGQLSSTGYIQVHAYTSKAQIPLEDVAVAITDTQGNLIAARLTNKSGQLDTPIAVTVPDISAGETPDTGIIPYADVNIFSRRADYEQVESENVQVFPQITTVQNIELIPLSDLPEDWNKTEIFKTPAQNL